MRKIFLMVLNVVLAIVLIHSLAYSQDWVNTNQATVAWDQVVYALDTGESLVYKVYLANSKTDPNKTNPALVGETSELQYQLTFTEKGSYFVGLQTVIRVDGEEVAVSDIGWSDDPQYAASGQTFGIRFYPAPDAPVGLRPVTQ